MTTQPTGTGGQLEITATLASQNNVTLKTTWLVTYRIYKPSVTYIYYSDRISVTVAKDGSQIWAGEYYNPSTSAAWTTVYQAYVEHTHAGDGTSPALAFTGWMAYSDTSGLGGPSSVTTTVYPPTLITAPNAPTSVVATRSSDISIGLAWTPNPATGKPYDGQSVMVSIDGATAVLVANVGAAVTSHTYAASANHKYVFTVVASNGAGSTSSAASNTILTTPAQLASLAGALVTSGTIRLTLPVRPTPYTEAQVVITETHDAGATWNAKTTIAMSSLSASTTTAWDDTSAETTGTVQYRAVVETTGGTQGTLTSAVRTSNTLILNTPPNAPTGLGPSGAVDASVAIRLLWSHSASVDGASQSSRKVEYSTDGGSSWTSIVSGNTTTGYYDWTPTLGSFTAGQTILWRVATAGSQPGTYGAWSASGSLTLYGSLAVVLTVDFPPETHTGGPLPVAWTSSATWGTATQAQYRVTMTDQDSSQVVFDSGMVAGSTESVSIPSAVQVNEHTYAVAVTLVDNHSVTSQTAIRLVETDYLPPGPIVLDWAYDDETGSLTVYPTFSEESSSPFDDTYEWTLERSIDGQTWTAVDSVIGENPITDVLVRVGADSYYRGVPTTALGIAGEPEEYTVPAADVTSRWGWLNYGTQNQSRVRFGWSQTVEVSSGRASDSYDVEGGDFPVAVFGQQKVRKVAVAGKLLSGAGMSVALSTSSASEMTALQETAGVVTFRDALGEWMTCRVSDMKVAPARTRATSVPVEAGVSFVLERVTA